MSAHDFSKRRPDRVTLSICIPTHHRARYLDCLLQDLTRQLPGFSFTYEVLIGDNASPDHTSEVVRKYETELNLRYFRRPENIGGHENLHQLYAAAKGEYLVYLADDDFLLIDAIQECIESLEKTPEVGAIFAPWLLYDRLLEKDITQFYSIDQDVRIERGNHGALFPLLINHHIFPEIYIFRKSLAQSINFPESRFAFSYFIQTANLLDRSDLIFCKRPFYRSVSRYFEDEVRVQNGNEQVKHSWDCYQGGLEYIFAKFSDQIAEEDRQTCRRAINQFIAMRMQVGLRIRTLEGGDWIDNYYIANRLRSNGGKAMLPAPYELYRLNAALEFFLALKPFTSGETRHAYFGDDPPIMLSLAKAFCASGLLVLESREHEIPANTVVLTTLKPGPDVPGVVTVSEAELMARYP
jgi:glycosyltransferase involved in cell wall biosynthesis